MNGPVEHLSPLEVARRLAAQPEETVLLDVREGDELALARFPEALWVPLQALPGSLDELPRDRDLIVACHHGIRSLHAAAWLREQGFTSVFNLAGGIDAWSREVDSGVPRY